MSASLRIGVVGATGTLGHELLARLDRSRLQIDELVPVATDRSLGSEVEFRGSELPVETEAPNLRGLDCVFLCTPSDVSRELVREALRHEVMCVDASGTMAATPEAPLHVAGESEPPEGSPLLVTPPGAALALGLVLRAFHGAAGLTRASATCLEAASWGGRDGVESLYRESIALFNQQEFPEPGVFGQAVAFDCVPALGEVDAAGETERERAITDCLERLVTEDAGYALQFVQVPTFVGFGATVALETARPLEAKEAQDVIEGANGVQMWSGFADGATLRAASAEEGVVVSRVRRDPSREGGLLLWLATDVVRLTADHAVRLAEGQLGTLH